MKKNLIPFLCVLLTWVAGHAQITQHEMNTQNTIRCATQISIENILRKNPGISQIWKAEGEKQFQAYLQRRTLQRGPSDMGEEIIIPVVFHLVDDSARLSGITDRDVYEQVELLNKAFGGIKADGYKNVIPEEIYQRLGRIPVKFVLARRTPSGALTSGIQRRINKTPGRIAIKSSNTGGLDPWDVNKYLNIWAGSFTGEDNGMLGIATPPFYTSEGPQGVVISLFTLPYTSEATRSYYPAYSEGVTLIHEVGHYFYLWHTFGDENFCNDLDFRIQSGWPLPAGAGPEGDDTPKEKADPEDHFHYGNPSQNYSDGCTTASYGMMYGSFMNYFDDRAMFMFSEGMKKRVVGCIDLYRPGLKNSNGATPPSPVTDAYLVEVSPRGTPERRAYITNNSPLKLRVRNLGSTHLQTVNIQVKMDGQNTLSTPYTLNLAPGRDTILEGGNITGATGTHTLTLSVSNPNNTIDAFRHNDTLKSYIFINQASINAPFAEDFSGSAFPPEGWQVWNPNAAGKSWERSTVSGFLTPGAATVQNYSYNGGGQMDELITPPINTGIADSSLLTFGVAYKVYNLQDVSGWDGLEVYVSNNGGGHYELIYKKTGNQLKSVEAAQTTAFEASFNKPENWRKESINLTPYLRPEGQLLIKFRNVNGYGNNLYIDDIAVSALTSVERDTRLVAMEGIPVYTCGENIKPSVTFKNEGSQHLTSLRINYKLDGRPAAGINWTGTLGQGKEETVELPPLPVVTTGTHTLTIYTSQPNGLDDMNVLNDTLRQTFYTSGRMELPVYENFENTGFPPGQWVAADLDHHISWTRTTQASSSGMASMMLANYYSEVQGTRDEFISPVITGDPANDSVFVSFDYAYATRKDGADISDTLEIAITQDCGLSFTTVWKKWGPELSTVVSGGSISTAFIPQNTEWRSIKADVLPITGKNNFQVFMKFKGNGQNNIFIDNIRIYGVSVPARLKEQGYLIYPNPFSNQFIIRNYEAPLTFRSAALFNAGGQRVWTQDFNGNASKEILVNGSNLPQGIYTLKLYYSDKTIVEKVVKLP